MDPLVTTMVFPTNHLQVEREFKETVLENV
jgi:hypothetical protein